MRFVKRLYYGTALYELQSLLVGLLVLMALGCWILHFWVIGGGLVVLAIGLVRGGRRA